MTDTDKMLEAIRRDPENLPGRITAAAYSISALFEDLKGASYSDNAISDISLFWYAELLEISQAVGEALKNQ